MQLHTVTRHIPHHAGHSGYDQLARYAGKPVRVPRWVTAIRGAGFIHRYFRKRSGMEWYDGLYQELFTALHMQSHSKGLYHFLFVENHFRYLPALVRKGKHRVIGTFHATGDEFGRIMRRQDHFNWLDFAVVVSQCQLPHMEALLGKDKVFFVPHGVDTEYFTPGSEEKSGEIKSCLCVGHHHRDFAALCETAKLVKNEDPAVRFTVVDRVFSVYLSLEEQNHFRKRFTEAGNIELRTDLTDDELLELYRSSDLLVLPLFDATANVALLESLSCGLPAVITDVGGVRDYADESCSGFASPQDAQKMSALILELSGDPVRRQKLSRAARERALTFDWTRIVEQMQEVYARL